MAIRVPTPVTQGAQNLGGAQAQAAATPYQRLTLPDTSFNSRMLQQIGQSGVQFANYLQEQEDERLLLEFQAGLGEFERGLLYGQDASGNPTGQGGILGLEGPDAFGLTERVQRDLDQQLSQYNTSLQGLSRNGRAAAQRYAQSRREALLDQTARFEFQQREAYNAKLRRQAEAAAAAAAETAWATPEAMADAETRIISATTNRAAAEVAGLTDNDERQQYIDDEIAAAVEEFQRTAILRAIGQGKTQIGRQLYDQAVERGTIKLQEDDLLTRTVQYGEQIDVVVNGATMLYERFPGDRSAAIDAARRMGLDGDTERDLVKEIESRYSIADRSEQDQIADLVERVRQSAAAGTMHEDFTAVELSRIPEDVFDRLNGINRGDGTATNPVIFNTLKQMLPEMLAQVDLTQYMDQLSPNDYADVVKAQTDARRAFADAAASEQERQQALLAAADASSRKDVRTQAFDQYKITDEQQQVHVTRMFEAWEADFVSRSRVAPTNEERRRFLDNLLSDRVTAPGFFLGGGESLADALLGKESTAALPSIFPDIPLFTLYQLGEAALAEGLPITEETIRELYRRGQ